MSDALESRKSNEALRKFLASNPDLNLLTADLHPRNLDSLDWADSDRQVLLNDLKAYQRLLKLSTGQDAAESLLEAGFHSAHHIGRLPERSFVSEHAQLFGGDEKQAKEVHRRASGVVAKIKHAWANIRNLTASPHYQSTLFQNVSPQLLSYFQEIPSYEDLFGGQDYCECAHCQSIFGPAAYFLDLMRITDEHITEPNLNKGTDAIPPKMKLEERRRDLFNLYLDCANTNDVVPYLRIVNSIVANRIEAELQTDNVFKSIAVASYPFNLPFQLPLQQIRGNLDQLKSTLFRVYQALLIPEQNWTAFDNADAAREYLSLSLEQCRFVTQPLTAVEALAAAYGYTLLQGTGRVSFNQGETTVTGENTDFLHQISPGDQIIVGSMSDTVVRVEEGQLIVSSPWTSGSNGLSTYKIAPFSRLSRLSEFLSRTGLNRTQLQSLLVQNLDEDELNAGVADRFFINATGEGQPYMRVVIDKTDPKRPFEKIEDQTLARLDRLNRFIRAASWLGWAFSDLDWAMVSVGANEIDESFVRAAARIVNLNRTTGVPVDLLSGFWHDLKTTGKHSTRDPQDAFDRVFNNPALLDGQNPYDTHNTPIPFDPSRPLTWQVDDHQGMNGTIRSRLTGALFVNDNDLTAVVRYLVGSSTEPILLTLSTLTQLYRFTKLAAVLRMKIDEFLMLLDMIALPTGNTTASGVPASAREMLAIIDQAAWLQASGLNVDELEYVLTGVTSPFVNPGYSTGTVKPFVENLSVAAESSRVNASLFIFETVNAELAEPIFRQLQAHRFITQAGIAFNKVFDYDTLLSIRAVTDRSLLTDDIDEAASAGAFALLKANEIVLDDGYVSPTFGPETNLRFLFPGDPDAEIKQGEVRSILFQIRDLALSLRENSFGTDVIDSSASAVVFGALRDHGVIDAHGGLDRSFDEHTDLKYLFENQPQAELKRSQVRLVLLETKRVIEHTVEILNTQRANQDDFVLAGLAEYLNTTVQMMRVLLPFVSPLVSIENYLVELLNPIPDHESGFIATVNPNSFVTSDITKAQSEAAFETLVERTVITLSTDGFVVELNFSEQTDLSFLFRDDADADKKRNEVRAVLLRTLRPARVFALIAGISRSLLLSNRLGLTPAETQFVIDSPAQFGIEDLRKPKFGDVRSIWTFKMLIRDFSDRTNDLIKYFRMPRDASCPGPKTEALATIAGWNLAQLCNLIESFWPQKTSDDYDSVSGVARLKKAFDLSGTTGLDVAFLLQLAGLHRLSLLDPASRFNGKNWETYINVARSTLDAVSVKYDAEFAALYANIESETDTLKRDALVPFAVWLLGENTNLDFIREPSDLYQYLLIDVEMSSCATTTPIAQAIASVQLYMQRCRMNIEPGITNLNIPDIWWEWMSSYRIWEANRKIFLYPENYLEPSLRRDKTPPFRKLSEALLQTELNEQSVARAYSDYFNDFATVARLVVCGSYSHTTLDPAFGPGSRTLYLFGRTAEEPYSYYYRTLSDSAVWSAWEPVNVNINARYVTPVFAFDRLFIFWTELTEVSSSTIQGSNDSNESQPQSVLNASVKYSFRSNGHWSAPQTLAATIPVNVAPDDYFQKEDEKIRRLFDSVGLNWQQPYALNIRRAIPGSGRISMTYPLRSIVVGDKTLFKREIEPGDYICCANETHRVVQLGIDPLLTVDEPWSITVRNAEYAIIKQNKEFDRVDPFQGTGTASADANGTTVTGVPAGTDTRFDVEFRPGDRIVLGGQARVVTQISNFRTLKVDRPFTIAVTGPFDVVPSARGNEKLLVAYGAEVPTALVSGKQVQPPDPVPNPGKDNFISELNSFNETLYQTLDLAEQSAAFVRGNADVVLSSATILDGDLQQTTGPLLVSDYKFSWVDSPQPYKPAIARYEQKLSVQQSSSSLIDNYWGNSAPGIESTPPVGQFVNLLFNVSGSNAVLSNVANRPDQFIFNNGDETFFVASTEKNVCQLSDSLLVRSSIYGLDSQTGTTWVPMSLISSGAYTKPPTIFSNLKFQFNRISTATIPSLRQSLVSGGIRSLLTLDSQRSPELAFDRFLLRPGTPYPAAVIPPKNDVLDFSGAYGPYFWEIFFHAPFLVAEGLRTSRRFDEARRWYQYIFDPTAKSDSSDVHPNDRYWRFLPFRDLTPDNLVEILTDGAQIKAYNDDPFDPDAIARLRPTAYAKAVVMRYIDNLIEWGDSLFTQDTAETINQATNLYVMAADLLGRRPEAVGVCQRPAPRSFSDIKKEYPKGIPQFLIELENTPFGTLGENEPVLNDVPFNDINSYFCVPENDQFMAYWDRVEDRLFKIRHCMNIAGIERPLAPFAPPINPKELVRAAAAGATGVQLAAQIEPPVPNYRFAVVLNAARSLTSTLIQVGSQLLTALERQDSEELARLQVSQQNALLSLMTAIKQNQIAAIDQTGESLAESEKSALERSAYYTMLVKQGISRGEVQSMQAMEAAMILNIISGVFRYASSVGYAIPNVGSPFAMTYGGQQIGSVMSAYAGALELGSYVAGYVADRSLAMAGYERRQAEWQLQESLAGYDVAQITIQMAANDTQRQIAEQDLAVHLRTIEQNREVEHFLKNKFTNKELYSWMAGRLSAVYFQTYAIALELSRSAQHAFQYELSSEQTFVNFGYWDSARQGLLAGEGLMLALNQMEKAYIDGNTRALEIERTVSLMQLNPKALLDLRRNGVCTFELSERLFDYDFPGHYNRKIKALAVSLPALVGPYQNIKATLTQMSNHVVQRPDASAVNFLLGGDTSTVPGPGVLRSNWRINQQIALSRGAGDAGLFQLDFQDERYLPFEGTGAVSTWRLEMPKATNRINFSTISDVVISINYAARDGGSLFRSQVTSLPALKPFFASQLISFNQFYSAQWFAFMQDHTNPDSQTLRFNLPASIIPPHLENSRLTGFYFQLDASGREAEGKNPYITFQLTDSVAEVFNLDGQNSYSFISAARPKMSDVFGARSIQFRLDQQDDYTPNQLKKDGFLDADAVKNIVLILYYESEVTWS